MLLSPLAFDSFELNSQAHSSVFIPLRRSLDLPSMPALPAGSRADLLRDGLGKDLPTERPSGVLSYVVGVASLKAASFTDSVSITSTLFHPPFVVRPKPPASPCLSPGLQQPPASPSLSPGLQQPPASPCLSPGLQQPPASPCLSPGLQQPPALPCLSPGLQQPPALPVYPTTSFPLTASYCWLDDLHLKAVQLLPAGVSSGSALRASQPPRKPRKPGSSEGETARNLPLLQLIIAPLWGLQMARVDGVHDAGHLFLHSTQQHAEQRRQGGAVPPATDLLIGHVTSEGEKRRAGIPQRLRPPPQRHHLSSAQEHHPLTAINMMFRSAAALVLLSLALSTAERRPSVVLASSINPVPWIPGPSNELLMTGETEHRALNRPTDRQAVERYLSSAAECPDDVWPLASLWGGPRASLWGGPLAPDLWSVSRNRAPSRGPEGRLV
ncbi:unnamed protein product [Arctogadus glacialis]